MEKLKQIGAFDMPAVDPSGAPINYYFGKLDENGQAIILNPKVGKTEQYLHDYNINNGDALTVIYEPIAGPAGSEGDSNRAASDLSLIESEQISALPPDLPKPIKIFGAVFNTFILIEYEDHLLMVDQHAVHERILYDKMMNACDERRAGQEMLVPIVIGVTKRELQTLEENREMLEHIGLIVETFGENEVAVRSVPVVLGQNETADFLHEAINELDNGRIPGADKKRSAILQQACKHAVKGGEPLPEDLLRSLVEEMIDRKVIPTCPHGRPLVVSISHTELDKKFKRIQ